MAEPLDNGAVLQMLGDMKSDMNRNFDLLVEGQKTLFNKFNEHEKQDDKRFEEIHVKAAEDKGEAKITAKLWGIGTGLVGGGLALLPEIWKYFHGSK